MGIGDMFADSLEQGRAKLDLARRSTTSPCSMPRGSSGAEGLRAALRLQGGGRVYIATPPYFHPLHLEAALAAGKHVYLEKPVAVDVPGAHKVVALGEKAKGRLSVAVGFQIRHASPYVELAKRIHAGQIGAPVSGEIHYFASAIKRPDWPNASPVERRLRNWVHDKALSGDIIVEQNIHVLDVTNWLLAGHPVKAVGSAGRAGRTDQGDCSSHYSCVYTYPNDVSVGFGSTQFGTGGVGRGHAVLRHQGMRRGPLRRPRADLGRREVGVSRPIPEPPDEARGDRAFKGALDDADPNKQKAFIESIVSGTLLNEAAREPSRP